MQTHVQARLVALRPRHDANARPMPYLAVRTTRIRVIADAAGVRIPVVHTTDALIALRGGV